MADPIRADQLDPSNDDLGRIAGRYRLDGLETVGGSENLILRGGGKFVRVTHTSRRRVADVEAEVAFMQHLAARDVPTVAPVPSVDGNLAESFTFADGTETVTYCMTAAPGSVKEPPDWTNENLVALGDMLGRAHAASRSFAPDTGPHRPAWTDDFFDPGTAQSSDPEVVAAWRHVRQRAAAHPAGGGHLLIHQDAHFWNLHVTGNGRLTLFDFDDCAWGTPEHDLVIVLFYWAFGEWEDPDGAVRRFLTQVLEGYRRHAELADDWPDCLGWGVLMPRRMKEQ